MSLPPIVGSSSTMAATTQRSPAPSFEKVSDPEKTPTVTESIHKYDHDGIVETSDPLAQFSEHEIKRAWRKVDLHILPVAVLLYLSSYIDRYVHVYLVTLQRN